MTVANLNLLYSRQRLFWRCSAVAVIFLASYLYLVSSVVFNVATRQNLLTDLSETSNKVVSLESEYLALSGRVTMDLAQNLGFHDATANAIFVELPAESPVVALRPVVLE